MHSIRFKITVITIAAILTSMLSIFGACFFTIASENDRISAEKMNLLCNNLKNSLEDYFKSAEQTVSMSSNLAADSLDGFVLLEGGAPIGSAYQAPDHNTSKNSDINSEDIQLTPDSNAKGSDSNVKASGTDVPVSIDSDQDSADFPLASDLNANNESEDKLVSDNETAAKSTEQKELLNTYMQDYCDRLQEIFGSVARRTHGVVSYYYCLNPEISPDVHGFFYSKAGKTGFDAQDPIDARTLNPDDTDHNMWYYTAISRGRPSWIGPYQDRFQGNLWTISYATPIYKAGALIGVLGIDIPFDIIVDQVSTIHLYESGFAALLDERGRILYHPDEKIGDLPGISDLGIYETVLTQSDSGDSPLRYNLDGEERQMSFTTLTNGMKLVVIAPVAEVMATWNHLTRIILLATLVITVIFVFIMMFSMGIIIRPLQQLTVASHRLADGDYDLELAYSGKDEIGILTGAFTQMRDHLKYYISDLNRRIHTDDMTGLPNRVYFSELAETARQTLLEEGKNPVILYLNPVGIRHYNRQYGFEAGNQLICEFAEILARHFGKDRTSYFGLARFAAISYEEDLDQRLKSIFQDCLNANGGQSVPIRAGVYPYRLGYVDVHIACDRAKNACDRHRGSYLCEYSYYDQTMLERNESYRYIINNLDRALEENWVKVYYQPIVRAATGKVCDEEALARWIDPVRGFLSPGDFIPVLESSRLIYKLDLYVLDQIILKMKAQQEAGLYVVPHSLNLSRIDFDECDIVAEILERVDRAGIPHDRLTIEITESVVGSDFDFIRDQVLKFQSLGFKVWMDDFGSGYSSLDVLHDIKFDLIKFDMHFMHRFEEGEESKIILTHLMEMAHALGTETLTEGVETLEQVQFLKQIGCSRLQGFYFSQPLPYEEILDRYDKGIQIGYESPEEAEKVIQQDDEIKWHEHI